MKFFIQKRMLRQVFTLEIRQHFINNNFYSMNQELTDVKICGQPNNEYCQQNFQKNIQKISSNNVQLQENIKPLQEDIKFNKNELNSELNWTQKSNKFSQMKVIYVGTSVIQTVNISTLIMLQGLSEKIEIQTLIFLIIISFVLLIIFVIFFWNASIEQINYELTNLEELRQKQRDNGLFSVNEPVLSKIEEKINNNNANKVKIQTINVHQVASNLLTAQRLKSKEQPAPLVAKDSLIQKKINKDCNVLGWFISTIVQLLFIFILTTIFLTMMQDSKGVGMSKAVILIIVSYLLIFFMLFSLFKLKKMSSRSRDPKACNSTKIKIEGKIVQIIIKPKNQMKAIFSFQQEIITKYYQGESLKVQKEQKETIYNFINPTHKPKFNKSQSYITYIENVPKIEFKKSALKTQRDNNLQLIQIGNQQTVELQIPETKRVEINSKQVEYFQYSQYQPSNQGIDDKINMKSDINMQKCILPNKKSMQRYKQQMQLLQKKKEANRVMTNRQLNAKIDKQQIVKTEKLINQMKICA